MIRYGRISALMMLVLGVLVACGSDTEQADSTLDITPEVEAFYADNPELITFASPADIPTDLVWDDGMQHPDIGSPDAVKGGTYYEVLEDFPPTFRNVGPDSNFSSRSWISGYWRLTWVTQHPDTKALIPAIAEQWAIDQENRTVYVKINPAARWSDGERITSDDMLFAVFFYLSEYIQAPFQNNYFSNEIENVTRYDELTFSVRLPKSKPDMAQNGLFLAPVPQHHYRELGEDYPERYQWRYEPHAGPYTIAEKDVEMGARVLLRRNPDWWAKDNKYWRNLYNPDVINLSVIRDTAKRYEAFRRGDLDIFRIATADMWYDNLPDDDPDIAGGYIHKNTFYNGGPRSNWGLWMNSAREPLDNLDVRLGVQYAANWQLVIDNYFRGDVERLVTMTDGFDEFSHPTLKARDFNLDLAAEHFARAGYTQRGPDGILVNAQGERLALTLTTHYTRFSDIFTILREEARKAGLELRIELLDGAASFRKAMERQHELYFVSFSPTPVMYPDFWQYMHSENAYDQAFLEDGSVNPERKAKTQTNNLQVIAIPELDEMIDAYDASEDKGEMVALSHRILERHWEYASFSPGWVEPFYRTAYWRWVRWPEGFNNKYTVYPYDSFAFWIDPQRKQETLTARENGQTFEPSIEVYDQFRED
ncbi:MAG: extracellular solute-binding protein [Pseudomonadales bacterium]|nr:extracellular solute-binding protein [Pseudomonadales bacterium]